MGIFSFMETSFFFTLGITFLLILLLVYHFKQRIITVESKQDTMFEIINNLVQEINNIKTSVALMNRPPTPYPRDLQNVFRAEQHVIVHNDEPDQESEEYDSEEDVYSDNDEDDEDDEDDEHLVIVSDNGDNNSIEELPTNDMEDIEEDIEEDIQNAQQEKDNSEQTKEDKPDFNKMNLGNLKSYILKQGWVEDASKMKKAQILSLIQEHSA